VALAPFGNQERIVSAPSRADFCPDLQPFAAALRDLGKRAIYREGVTWRLSPTLHRQPDGTWRFVARGPRGESELRQIERNVVIDGHFERLYATGSGTLQNLSVRTGVPQDFLDRLIDRGILLGGLCFPARFTSPWEALEITGNLLAGNDRICWKRATSLVAESSESLAGAFDRMAADDVAKLTKNAQSVMAQLFSELGVSVEVPLAPFRCDLKLPLDL